MKTLLLCLVVLATATAPQWQLDFDAAQAEAKAARKHILLNFSGSDWCGPCIKLKKDVFESAAFQAYAEKHLVLVRADFPRAAKNQLSKTQTAHNESLADRYNPDGAFPLTVLLDANGRVLQRWNGYPADLTPETLLQAIDTHRPAAD
jgi:thioredoxin-related protein